MAERGALERPGVVVDLCRALAIGDVGTKDLATRYGCSRQAIALFARRHRVRILEVRRCLDDQFAGIEFATKRARVEAYSDQAIKIRELLDDPEALAKVGVGRAEMERVFQSALRSIAEELGDLPARVSVQVAGRLDVAVNGVDLGDLR